MGVMRDIVAVVAAGAGAAAALSYWKGGSRDMAEVVRVAQAAAQGTDVRRLLLQSIFFVAVVSLATDFVIPALARGRVVGRRRRLSSAAARAAAAIENPRAPEETTSMGDDRAAGEVEQEEAEVGTLDARAEPSDLPSSSSSAPNLPAEAEKACIKVSQDIRRVREDQQQAMNDSNLAKSIQKRNKAHQVSARKQAQVPCGSEEVDRVQPRSPEDDLKMLVACAREEHQRLCREQDEAYAASLQVDCAKESERRRQEIERQEEIRRTREEDRQKAAQEVIKLSKQAKRESLPPEPVADEPGRTMIGLSKQAKRESLPPEPVADEPGRTMIGVRLLDSSVHRRSWHCSAYINQLYNWIDSLEAFTLQPEEYSLFTAFPRKELARQDWGGKSLEEGGLCPQSLVIVDKREAKSSSPSTLS
ncbi:hypothetical protein CBR_g44455 [Chara braunii]|uniref:UBX domain-containing protein n=1 Tax=Chara braunii TaxID=69332 RepID=A0A388LXE9_CHABU|nr:hypothetical protein CBR_g44455 [Chara braunii]|eukprot:GBG87000.1 hypothetical protein CBR_g44455 [Chara braunii]